MAKLKFILPVVILVIGLLAGKTFLTKAPAEAAPKPKVHGEVYILPKDFLVNLKDSRFAKLNVGLILKHGYLTEALEAAAGKHGAPKPPDGYGTLPQEALVRDVITDALTGAAAGELIAKANRKRLKESIVEDLKKSTDVEVIEVIFTDVAVQ